MAVFKQFKITKDEKSWNYVVEIQDSGGTTMRMAATFKDLDTMAVAIEEQMLAIIDAAECPPDPPRF